MTEIKSLHPRQYSGKSVYGSDSAGRGKCLFYVLFSKKVEPPCDQTWLFRIDCSIDNDQIWVLHPGKIIGRPWNFFLVPCYGHLFTILANFWVKIAVWIKPPCVYTCKNRLNMKCPSSSPLNFDDFPFFLNLCSSSGTRVRTC